MIRVSGGLAATQIQFLNLDRGAKGTLFILLFPLSANIKWRLKMRRALLTEISFEISQIHKAEKWIRDKEWNYNFKLRIAIKGGKLTFLVINGKLTIRKSACVM